MGFLLLRAASQLTASGTPLARFGFCALSATARRYFSSTTPIPEQPVEEVRGFSLGPLLIGAGAAAGVGTSAAYQLGYFESPSSVALPEVKPVEVKKDYNLVKQAIADILEDPDYDDGSYGPLLVRLAWHASGTYSKHDGTGGSNGCLMRFHPEAGWGANAGLDLARQLLDPLKAKFPWVSYADLYTLAGAVAIEEMGGPHIPWRPGRSDAADGSSSPRDGRLPDADKGAAHVRDIFYRMGFNDQEIVALSGAHTLGRCHADRSGYVNPWTNAPTTFSNLYFTELKNQRWFKKRWNGPLQYEDRSKQLMMLPTDMALIWDRGFRKFVDVYAKEEELFFKDFAFAFSKLLELGVPLEGEYM